MDTSMLRRMLAVLLLCSLAFEVAFARVHRHHHEDGYYHKGKGGRHKPIRGKAKGYYAQKGKPHYYQPPPTYNAPEDSYVPPPYESVPSPVASPPSPVYSSTSPSYEKVAPKENPTAPPLASPPLYEEAAPPIYSSSPPPYEKVAPEEEPSAPSPYQSPRMAAVVQGVVFCQNCNYVGTSYYSYGKPLPGATIKIACQLGGDNSPFEAKVETDDRGHFLIDLPDFDFKKYNVVDYCKVYLVSSSVSTCSTPTDINFGISGSPIQWRNTSTNKILYSSGPLVFAPKYCDPSPPPPTNSPPQNW